MTLAYITSNKAEYGSLFIHNIICMLMVTTVLYTDAK